MIDRFGKQLKKKKVEEKRSGQKLFLPNGRKYMLESIPGRNQSMTRFECASRIHSILAWNETRPGYKIELPNEALFGFLKKHQVAVPCPAMQGPILVNKLKQLAMLPSSLLQRTSLGWMLQHPPSRCRVYKASSHTYSSLPSTGGQHNKS